MFTTQPDELTFAAELRQLRFETEARRIAAARRMGRNAAWMHPDAREPEQDYDNCDCAACREPDDYEPEEDHGE